MCDKSNGGPMCFVRNGLPTVPAIMRLGYLTVMWNLDKVFDVEWGF